MPQAPTLLWSPSLFASLFAVLSAAEVHRPCPSFDKMVEICLTEVVPGSIKLFEIV